MRKPKPMKIITWTSWNTEKKGIKKGGDNDNGQKECVK